MLRTWMFWRRCAISAFLVAHLSALLLWNLPACPLRQRTYGLTSRYIMPTGQWQYWGMFAPDPGRDTITLEALAVDARGIYHNFAFPKMADFGFWESFPKVRHSKYAANVGMPEQVMLREFAARHAARRLELPESAYPVDLELFYQYKPSPEPGQPPDPMTPMKQHTIQMYRFLSPEDVRS